MHKTVIGLFDNGNQASQAISALLDDGFSRESIRVLSNEPGQKASTAGEPQEEEGTGSKLVSGFKGLLADIGLLNKEEHGVPRDKQNLYSEGIKKGKTLVMLYTDQDSSARAVSILDMNGARNVDDDSPVTSSSGFSRVYDRPQGTVQSVEESSGTGTGGARVVQTQSEIQYESIEPQFRAHWQNNYASQGYGWEYYSPAYRFGYDLANMPGHPSDWNTIEPQARGSWESRNPGTWDKYKELVKEAWNKTRSLFGAQPTASQGVGERTSAPRH